MRSTAPAPAVARPRSPASDPVSTSVRTLSSRKNGLPSVRSISRRLSGSRARSVAEQRVEQLLGALGRQRVDPELACSSSCCPQRVPVLGPVVHQEQDPRRRQALDQAVEQRLGLGVDPVEVLEDQQERLDLALAEQEALDRVERPLAPLRRVERLPLRRRRPARPAARGAPAGWLKRAVQRQELPRHLLAHRPRVVPVLDPEVALEQIDHRQIGRRLPVGDRAGLRATSQPCDAMGVRDLPHQSRLPDARLADDGDHLAMPGGGAPERLAELLQLGVPPDEAGEARGRRPPGGASAAGPAPDQLVHLDRRVEPLDRHRTQRRDLDDTPRPAAACRRSAASRPALASCSIRAARCVVWPTAV